MRKALAAVPLALLTLLGVREAMADGRKMLTNETPYNVVVELGIRASNGLPILGRGERMTLSLLPRQAQWFEYKGSYLDWVTVNGAVWCEVKSNRLGDQADTLLNTNSFLNIKAHGDGCVITGRNGY